MSKQTTPKSTTTYVKQRLLLATCLILAALGPPAAELSRAGGSSPVPINQTFVLDNACGSFEVQATVTGKAGTITLPNGGFIFTAPGNIITFTNLSDPTKSVTLNVSGPAHATFDTNGNGFFTGTGTGFLHNPSIGILYLVGNFTFVFDSNGNLIQGPTGNGKIVQVCDLIN